MASARSMSASVMPTAPEVLTCLPGRFLPTSTSRTWGRPSLVGLEESRLLEAPQPKLEVCRVNLPRKRLPSYLRCGK